VDGETHRTPDLPGEFGIEHPSGEWISPSLVEVLGVRRKVRVDGLPEQRIAAIARLQRGCISRRQLIALGFSAAAISRLIRRGTLLPLRRGVFAVGHLAPMPLRDETTALLAVRRAVALSHASAAALWGLAAEGARGGVVDIVVAGDSGSRLPGIRAHRSRRLRARDIRIRHGLPVTSPAWTLLDQAETLAGHRLEMALNEARVQHLITDGDLADVLKRANGRRGATILRRVLEDEREPTLTRSDGEKRMLALVRAAQLPSPLVNAPLHGFEVDFYWPTHGVVVEIDSVGFHSTPWAVERDRRKDAALRAHGLPPVRFSWRQVRHEPFLVIAQVAEAIARGRAHPG
jgi:very-short-patch-repair endonuclease